MENNSKTFHGIHVLKATGLINADWGSESDPYFLCRVGRKDSKWSEKFLEIQSQGKYHKKIILSSQASKVVPKRCF